MVTLYDVLGVRDDATEEEIKRAYRRAAMRSHPDRNVGREAAAHAGFQQVKEAYAILSDPEQRRIYDAVYAEEMGRLTRHREEERRRAEEEAEAEYARYVTLAIRFADQGHARDVLFGVLLGRDCEPALAARIADGVAALQASRAAESVATDRGAQAGPGDDLARDAHAAREGRADNEVEQDDEGREGDEGREAGDAMRARGEGGHTNLFSALWHGMFGLRP